MAEELQRDLTGQSGQCKVLYIKSIHTGSSHQRKVMAPELTTIVHEQELKYKRWLQQFSISWQPKEKSTIGDFTKEKRKKKEENIQKAELYYNNNLWFPAPWELHVVLVPLFQQAKLKLKKVEGKERKMTKGSYTAVDWDCPTWKGVNTDGLQQRYKVLTALKKQLGINHSSVLRMRGHEIKIVEITFKANTGCFLSCSWDNLLPTPAQPG